MTSYQSTEEFAAIQRAAPAAPTLPGVGPGQTALAANGADEAAPGAGQTGTGEMDLEPWVSALRALGDRQLGLIVLHKFLGLPAEQAAEIMRISNGDG